MSRRYRLTRADAELIARFVGIRWADAAFETSEEEQRLLDLRFNNVLRFRTARVELRAWATKQWQSLIREDA